MRGYWAILCVSVALSACGGGGGSGAPAVEAPIIGEPIDDGSAARAAAIQRQSEMGTATLGTARLQ